MEAGAVISDKGKVLYWHLPQGRSVGFLPDVTPDPGCLVDHLWYFVMEYSSLVVGFAHSHPGDGIPSPSHEDITTFSAWERALGKRLKWWIVNDEVTAEFMWVGPGKLDYGETYRWSSHYAGEPAWVEKLRILSVPQIVEPKT